MLMKLFVNDPQKRAVACKFLTVAVLLGVGLLIAYGVKWTYGRITGHRQSVDDDAADKAHSRAKFLVRESARLVASALEKRNSNLLDAYEDAAQAAVLARTAKEIDDDVSKLTQDLGVDFYEYLTYTASVLQDVRSKLRRL